MPRRHQANAHHTSAPAPRNSTPAPKRLGQKRASPGLAPYHVTSDPASGHARSKIMCPNSLDALPKPPQRVRDHGQPEVLREHFIQCQPVVGKVVSIAGAVSVRCARRDVRGERPGTRVGGSVHIRSMAGTPHRLVAWDAQDDSTTGFRAMECIVEIITDVPRHGRRLTRCRGSARGNGLIAVAGRAVVPDRSRRAGAKVGSSWLGSQVSMAVGRVYFVGPTQCGSGWVILRVRMEPVSKTHAERLCISTWYLRVKRGPL